MIRALVLAVLASCATDDVREPDGPPTCAELGCEHALCSSTTGECRCVPEGETESIACVRE